MRALVCLIALVSFLNCSERPDTVDTPAMEASLTGASTPTNELSRNTAREILDASPHLLPRYTIEVPEGRHDLGLYVKSIGEVYRDPTMTEALIVAGELTAENLQDGRVWFFTLSDEIAQYKVGERETMIGFPPTAANMAQVLACGSEVKEITGIRLNGDKTRAEVQLIASFNVFTPYTAWSSICRDKEVEWGGQAPESAAKEVAASVYFVLFDDGWRIDPNPQPF